MPRKRLLTINGITKTATEWARESGLSLGAFTARIDKLGWTLEEAVQAGDARHDQETRERMSILRMGEGNPAWNGGWTKEKKAEYARKWRKENEDHVRDREYRKRFGISLAEYEAMLQDQMGLCAICNGSCPRGRLSVDHDHATGQVRGLLCRSCNIIIGLLRDDPEWLRSAEAYLARKKRSTA